MKKIRLMIASVVVADVCSVNITISRQGEPEFVTQNVEALARGESDYIVCWGSGDIICPGANFKARIVMY